MTKKIKKLSKRFIVLTMIFAMLISYFVPITRVFANSDYTITFSVSGNHTMENENGHLKIDGQYVELRDSNNDSIGTVSCNGNICTITVSDGPATKLNYNSANKFTLFMQGHEVDVNFAFSANENIDVQDYVEHQEGNEPGGEPRFDGHAYVLWSCGAGTCYHEFFDIPDFNNGESTFYKATDIKADNNNSIPFDVHAQYKAWVLPDRFNYWTLIYKEQNNIEEINWADVDPEDIIAEFPPNMGEWERAAIDAGQCIRPQEGAPGDLWNAFQWCVDDYYTQAGNLPFIRLQPVGEPEDNNAYVSYGDRNFKVVIYNDDFKGISMGDLSELSYYPEYYTNPFVRQDQFDISGTTKNRPTLLNSILLESTVIIRALNYNSFVISSIEALDVPEDAVTITKESNGDFKLVFSSNFYDNVVFKVTDTKSEVSYLQVKRFTIDGWVANNDEGSTLIADFYFDREKSYSDFDLTAKVILNDGSTKNVILTAKNGIDDGLGNITDGYEVDEQSSGGKGLKKSTFVSKLEGIQERDIDKIYLNAEYKGSTASNYAGAYVGSGEGTLANLYKEEGE